MEHQRMNHRLMYEQKTMRNNIYRNNSVHTLDMRNGGFYEKDKLIDYNDSTSGDLGRM